MDPQDVYPKDEEEQYWEDLNEEYWRGRYNESLGG